ncbi:D-isomer specific 2-hydroxyacid dehydrogenase [Xylaria nigripes]|nr:D-isomer specific 2-hydroxyacid dehydrogenase [Xylaria nigripes]
MDSVRLPKQLPGPTHEVIVILEEVHLAIENIDTAPRSHELISYWRSASADEVRSRIQCASIVVATQAYITAESLGEAPYLKCVITPTAGTNHIDVDECRRRGIKVATCPGSTSLAVPEHALSLFFAARRKTVTIHNLVRTVDENGRNAWKREGSLAYKMQTANGNPPLSLRQEVVGIIGYGHIGKGLERLCKGLGMKVLIIERKKTAGSLVPESVTNGIPSVRTPFEEAMRSATVLFISCPFNEETHNLIDEPELAVMRPETIIINVSRAGVMRSSAVVQALREKRISGVAVDVFEREPASTEEDSALLAEDTKDLNLIVSSHLGYYSEGTFTTVKAMVNEHIKNFVLGNLAGI